MFQPNILTYSLLFTPDRNIYYGEPHVVANCVKLSPDSLTDIHRHVHDKAIGRPLEAFTAIPIYKIVWYPIGIQVKQDLVPKMKF